ncbi:uncharacterized protein C18orf19 homolog B-like [Oncorhynchus keta]|uniref:uncharacterized protein C18orf19 homolog B-like n=1 Tax=Oncorhynchus keta TaxID=8018 RepID=UPI00227CE84E|nr:uncharacterized protein C18orf19 homolog B-like [Oncorhynchus keta]
MSTTQKPLRSPGRVGVYCRPPAPGPGQHWISTSAFNRAVEQPKLRPEDQDPPSHPPSLAGTEPVYGADSSKLPVEAPPEAPEIDPLQDKSIGLVQRFKKTFKQYGKVMIPVHLLTSSVWFGTFYYAAMQGVNVVPFLEFIGLPEKIVGLLNHSSGGYALTAYAMYKIATPARYTVTLGGTSFSVQYLRKHGYFSTPPPVKDYLQDRMEETREKLTEKMEETKELFSEKMEETKELLSGKMEDTKERLSERFSGKMEETKERFSDKLQEAKDEVSYRKKLD